MRSPNVLLLAVVFPTMLFHPFVPDTHAQTPPIINLPYFPDALDLSQGAISWFGQVTPTLNYTDIRAGFNPDRFQITLHVFDRLLWYNQNPSSAPLTDYDSASLYLITHDSTTYRLDAQINHWQNRASYQNAYRWENNHWQPINLDFTTTSSWRGNGFNDLTDDRGWIMTFRLPFSSLNLTTPIPNTAWSMGLVVYDRDDAQGTPIPPQTYPPHFNPLTLEYMGTLMFNPPSPSPPPLLSTQSTVIRHGLNNQIVTDAHVGGHTNCGQPYSPNFFDGWGDANYEGYTQINIQNQWDVADWPCFSKYIITFPLSTIPQGKTIISAELKLFQFGNAGASGQAEPSYIHVLTTSNNWTESQVTWNTAPPPQENSTASWVDPLTSSVSWPGAPRTWDVTKAITQAYPQASSATLYLYSSDGAYHSGKYFSSSDTGDWNSLGRPTLTVVWTDTSPLSGDLNHDGFVDFPDYSLLTTAYHQTNCAYNLLGTCLIDLFDLNSWIRNFMGI